MKEKTLGLYIHIPFCVAKCHYCDFCSFPAMGEDIKAAYTAALINELRHRAPAVQDHTVETVFFGGGTPTCLPTDCLTAICRCIKEAYRFSSAVEWTSEANPATVDTEKLHAMRAAGINRISLGMQSAHENELALLGRVHRPPDLTAAVAAARAAGFSELNLDLMFGIPAQTEKSFSASLDLALSLSPTHLSVYSLQLEEGTPFFERRHSLPLPDEETEAAMADLLIQKTAAHGMRRYEISNYALPGHESRHNLRYWQMQDYLGFGISAHSCLGDHRFYNRSDLSAYLTAPCSQQETEEILTLTAREYEAIMLGLRLSQGIEEQAFFTTFGHGFYSTYGVRLAKFAGQGLFVYNGKRTYLTARGMALSNTLLAEILDD